MRIAICDDELSQLSYVSELLDKYCVKNNCRLELFRYDNPSTMIDHIEAGVFCDIYILDVFLPGMSGISIAQTLRRVGAACSVIFLTASVEHALEAFSVNAVQYLLKPCAEEKLFAALDEAMLRSAELKKRYAIFKEGGEYTSVAVQDILYARANGNYQILQVMNGRTITLRATAGELLEMLSEYRCFFRCDKSHIVNLKNIRSFGPKACILVNGVSVPVSRKLYAALKDAFFDFYAD